MTEYFRNTLSLWQWGLLALVPPAIIALYFLKLRRQPLEVPSTYLWNRSLEDLHVNSLWQQLRQNLLMFLQLVLVGLAIFALLRPGWEGTRLKGDRLIFLIDNSASMAATDVDGASNRLAEAKQLAKGFIDQMDSNLMAMIISFSESPQVVQEFTSNRRLLRERLSGIQPSAHGTDLSSAIKLASGLASPGRGATTESDEAITRAELPPATTYIFSDGRFEDVAGGVTSDYLQPIYVPVGSFDSPNLAITVVSTRTSEERPDERQAFVEVSNFTPQPQRVIVELALDGQFLDAAEADVPVGEAVGTVFPLPVGAVGALTARLKYQLGSDPRDVLAADDIGYAAINDTATGRVLVVTPGNIPLNTALVTERARRLANTEFVPPASLDTAAYRNDSENGTYDLIIYDQCAPVQMPRANTLFIGRLPPTPDWIANSEQPTVEAMVVGPQILDWNRASPLLAHVELGDIVIAESLFVQPPAGGDVLIEATAGPIAAVAPRDSYQDVVLGFEIVGTSADGAPTANTNWPLRQAFPTFWLNALEHLAGHGEVQQANNLRPGRPIELHVPANAQQLSVLTPDGRTIPIERSRQNFVRFSETQQPGVYQVRLGDQVLRRFAVNLFDRTESEIGVKPTQDSDSQTLRPADIRIGEVEIAASSHRTPGRVETWKILLACALSLLVLEWYIYNRRVYL